MIKSITDARIDASKILLHLEALDTIEKLKVDRSEHTFGGEASLTQEEINQIMDIVYQAQKRTAW